MDDIINQITLTLGASWASGINLYATILALGIMHASGTVVLPEGLEILANPLVLVAAGIMYFVEFFADKIPGVDSTWDAIHTFIRIPAGIMMAYGAAEGAGPAVEMAAMLVGGSLTTMTHATKMSSRAVINTSPEPFSNWTASLSEDAAVFGGIWAALYHPWIFAGFLLLFVLFMIWILPKLWRTLKRIFAFIGRMFGGEQAVEDKGLESGSKS